MMDQDKTAGRGLDSWAELAEQAKIDGFSRSIPSGEMPTGGFMVALDGFEQTIPVAEFTQAHIIRYVADKWDQLTAGGEMFLGAWQAGGLVYLDVSECIQDRALALDVAKLRNQLAVWDVVNSAEVTV